MNKMAINMYLSVIALSVNGLNAPIKGHGAAKWVRKQDPYICCLQQTHLRTKDTQVQESQRFPKKMNPKRPTPRHIIIKMAKVKDKEINLKSSKRKAVSCL